MTESPVPTGAGASPSRFRRALRWAGAILAALLGLVLVTALAAPRVVRGARFARILEGALPKMRGEVHVTGGAWSWGAVWELARGRPAPVVLEGLRIIDPERVEVLNVRRLRAELEVHRAPLRIVIRKLRVEDGAWVFARMKTENKVGFFAALEAVARPGARPAKAGGSVELSIPDARLEHVTTTLDLAGWGLFLKDGSAAASLYARAGGGQPPAFRFEVRDADIPGGGKLRVLDGRAAFFLPFSRGRIDRVGTTAEDPDALFLDASGVKTGDSTLTLTSRFYGLYGLSPASRRPGLTLDARFEDAADAAQAIARSKGFAALPPLGPAARVRARFDGPFAGPRGELSLESPSLGRVAADEAIQGRVVFAGLSFEHFQLARVLPAPLAPFAAGTLDGHVRGRFGLDGSAELDDMALILTRPPGVNPQVVRARIGTSGLETPRRRAGWGLNLSDVRYSAGTIALPRIVVPLYDGRLSAAGKIAIRDAAGKTWLPTPVVDLTLGADRLPLERLLGTHFVKGEPTLRARVRGPLSNLDARVAVPRGNTVAVVGQPFALPREFVVRIAEETLSFHDVLLAGPEASAVEASGRVGLGGRVDMKIRLADLPLGRLPGLAETQLPIAGRVSGDLDFERGGDFPQITGQLVFGPVTFQGRPVGGGTFLITHGPKGGIRGHGRIVDGLDASGELVPGRAGLSGEATIDLDRLRLDPFLPPLPGGMRAAGILSGHLAARIAPGRAPEAEGRLRELTLVLTPPVRKGRAGRPLELHAESEIPLAAQSGGGPITIGPAHFRGDVGAFELFGESHGQEARGTLRGRIELGAFAHLLSPWLERLGGAIDVDLAASPGGGPGGVLMTGDIAIAAPLALRPVALPVDVRASAGRLRLRGTSVDAMGLAFNIRAPRLVDGAVRDLDAAGRIDAHVSGTIDTPVARARVALDQVSAQVPLLGPTAIVSEGGHVALESRGDAVRLTDVDLPVRGEARGVAVSGSRIDAATFALRLRGDPARRFEIAGDVDVLAAKVSAAAASHAGGGAASGGAKSGNILSRPEVENAALDVRLRSRAGAIVVDVPNLPDLRVDLDMHVGGTVKKPAVSGQPHGANVWSRIVLGLARLFR